MSLFGSVKPFLGVETYFFVEAHNSIYFLNIKFSPYRLHINLPTKRLQNDLICVFFPFLTFCGVVNVEVGQGERLSPGGT